VQQGQQQGLRDEDMIITNNSNVIYTFDYFVPERFSFGKEQMPTYPGTYKCDDLYRGFSHECCTGQKGGNEREVFNATWNKNNFQKWAVPVRKIFSVPIFVNQWGVVHGVNESGGRYAYMSDTARSLQELNIGWTWWVWRGGGGRILGRMARWSSCTSTPTALWRWTSWQSMPSSHIWAAAEHHERSECGCGE
jgi:hypothetical protein